MSNKNLFLILIFILIFVGLGIMAVMYMNRPVTVIKPGVPNSPAVQLELNVPNKGK